MKKLRFYNNSRCQLAVNIISAVLDGNGAVAPAAGYDSDWLTTVAAQREQKGVKLFIIGFNAGDDVLRALWDGH